MRLSPGMCYEVEMVDGNLVTFRCFGQDEDGTLMAESPPGSGIMVDLFGILLAAGYKSYRQIECPK
jgi:hypothetical protein